MKTVLKMRIAACMYRVISTSRKLAGASDSARVTRNGLHWELDLSEGVDLAIFLFGQFENATAKVLEKLVPAGAIVLDIGANIGAQTLPLARLVGSNGKVYAFEPPECAFCKMKQNLALNPNLRRRVVPEQARLTSPGTHDPGEIYSSLRVTGQEARHKGHLGIAKSTKGARVITLDEYLEGVGARRIDFIKLDVDGFEVDVLRGAKKTLRCCRPSICMELQPYGLEERGTSVGELLSVLREGGYTVVDLKGRSAIIDSAGRLKAQIPDGAGINVLAVPDANSHRPSSI